MKIIIFLLVFATSVVEAKDITQFVIANTNVDEKVASACKGKCGNRGWSKFESLQVTHKKGNLYTVIGKGSAKFHNVFEFAGGLELEFLVKLTATGTLNAFSCILTVNHIDITGDTMGITDGAKAAEGKKYRIRDCKKYT